ncbi:MAG TPA: enoyl-CoA hydratase/isomerase family protein [Spirochaetota bacterium]|nr:enoyl-CoA hydratase/isomerase family protein [Spirochaetota bacterium]HPI88510.1 enoyl-CoA hydratase/isomerase family protein [Spirochaetota bacterium]HPR47990.1 enoyl-CoA hydratase/isomerase family protein [Spirochaetota bacterium]
MKKSNSFRFLKTRRENSTIWIEINHPPVNFLTTDLLEEIFILVKKIRTDPSIRVVVLTGARDDIFIMHFSIPELLQLATHNRRLLLHLLIKTRLTSFLLAGFLTITNRLMDLFPWLEWLILKGAKAIRKISSSMFLWLQMHRLYLEVERLNKITIAAINGPCNGGGTELSVCFDFRFMVSDQGFTIGQPECLVNIIPGGGSSQRLPRLIGRAKALELMLRGNQLTPVEAKQIGLVTDIFPKKEFRKKVQDFADLMAKRPPVAIDAIKKSVLLGMDTTLTHGLSIELTQSLRCLDTRDTDMAMRAYINYIDEHIMTVDPGRATTRDVVGVLNRTLDVMENARIFEKFQGK